MKNLTKQVVLAMITASVFSACGPTAEGILKKYGAYIEAGTAANKAGVSIEMQPMGDVLITCTNSLLNACEDNMQKLSKRWFVADAENPGVKLSADIAIATAGTTVIDTAQSAGAGGYHMILKAEHIKERFLLIGFEGIAPIESKEAETPPLFFLVDNNGAESKILTPIPKLAAELFTAGYTPVFFSEQDYSGEISFANSKNVMLQVTLSADLQQAMKFKFLVGEMNLTPANFDKQRKNSEQKSIFKYLENSRTLANYAIQTENGYRVFARDASGNMVISNLLFEGGGFEATSPIDIIEGKITLNDRPLICDLTVTNACVYGTIKVEMNECGTQSTYAVFKNTTVPQDIPEDILNQLKK